MLIWEIMLFGVLVSYQHSLFTEVLSAHVTNGRVRYSEIKADPKFQQYLNQLANTNPDNYSKQDEKKAFWLNAYNAFTIKAICDNYPVKSIKDISSSILPSALGGSVWDIRDIVIHEKKYSLNDIEHNILRKMGDARVHFAMVCAAKSCPSLRSEAYEPEILDRQLTDQGILFLNDQKKNKYDTVNNTVYLSQIFKWFAGDFGEIRSYVKSFLKEEWPADAKIKYYDYDWSLNE